MDIFALRDRVVGEYQDYFESFVNVLDDRVREFVDGELKRGVLWPNAVLQLNPAYAPGDTLAELATKGAVLPETARFFGPDLRLHRHQQEVLDISHWWHRPCYPKHRGSPWRCGLVSGATVPPPISR